MSLLRWCLSYLTIVSLSYGLDPSDSGCFLRQQKFKTTEFHCKLRNSASGISIELHLDQFLTIRCDNTVNWLNLQYQRILDPQIFKNSNFESCQPPEKEQIDFIMRNLTLKNVREMAFELLNINVALNISQSIMRDFKGIKSIFLTANEFTNISAKIHPLSLQKFSDLEYIDLTYNVLRKLPDDFLKLPNLGKLHLHSNGLEMINAKTFSELKNIRRLTISEENLHQIEPKSFDKMVSLEHLEVHGGKFQCLPENLLSNLWNLEILKLEKNDFSYDLLTSDFLRNNSRLAEIHFNNNKQKLIELPNRFLANLTHLEKVVMSRNGLITLPDDLISGTINLLYLIMNDNNIKSFPTHFFKDCGQLLLIDFRNNQIDFLPDEIFTNQTKLRFLNLSNNRISTISSSAFEGIYSLETLNMENNNLQTINFGLWCSKLRIANFSHNNLTLKNYIEDENSLFYHVEIEELDLSFNNISQLINYWLPFQNLRNLNLQHNQLEKISSDELNFSSTNLRVDLNYNRIKEILIIDDDNEEESNPRSLRNLLVVIGNNPIECDCKIHSLLRHIERNMQYLFQIDVGNLKCRGPNWLKNTPLKSLKSETLKCSISQPQVINATCPDKCECWIRPQNRTYLIDCSNRGFKHAPEQIKAPLKHQIELNLTGNFLTSMPSLSQSGYDRVTVLLLSHNNINYIHFQPLLRNLRILELHYNKLSRIDTSILNYLENSTNLTSLTLHGNPWECNCEQKEFWKFIQATRLRLNDLNNITCGDMKQKMSEISLEEICPNYWLIASCIGIALLGIIIGGLAAMYYRYQQEIKIWLYARQWCLWWVSEDELDKDKIYDAFISYSHQDDDFVVNELVAKLEEGPRPFKLCVHYRDWPVGEWIPKQVARSVDDSKRIIVVLSSNFLHSEWGKMEFRAAHRQALSEGRARVIVIIYGEIPPVDHLDSELQAYLTMNTYVKWGDPWFWEKLRYALPHQS